jgi:branched-chain amino acid aminotransferase
VRLHFRGVNEVYIDGELVPESLARVSVFDHGFVTGDGVFETVLVREGKPFALQRHLDRLARSASGLGLTLPAVGELEQAVAAVAGNGPRAGRARLRITVTAGTAPLGSGRGSGPASVVVAVAPLTDAPPAAAVAVVPWSRNENSALAGLKTTSYAENVIALEWASARGASEAIFGNTVGNLCEGTGSNVFVVIGGALLTPPLSSGLLAGVTRDLVLELVAAAEKDVPLETFARGEVEEAFLTSTTRGVQAISSIGGTELRGAPGPLTGVARGALSDLMSSTDVP